MKSKAEMVCIEDLPRGCWFTDISGQRMRKVRAGSNGMYVIATSEFGIEDVYANCALVTPNTEGGAA